MSGQDLNPQAGRWPTTRWCAPSRPRRARSGRRRSRSCAATRSPRARGSSTPACGTGEIFSRLACLYPEAAVLGIDVVDAHPERARARSAEFAPRLRFEGRSIFETGLPDRAFALTICRQVLQSIPQPERALAELVRVTVPGGRLHMIPEVYGMIQFPRRALDPAAFWSVGPSARSSRRSGSTRRSRGRRRSPTSTTGSRRCATRSAIWFVPIVSAVTAID